MLDAQCVVSFVLLFGPTLAFVLLVVALVEKSS